MPAVLFSAVLAMVNTIVIGCGGMLDVAAIFLSLRRRSTPQVRWLALTMGIVTVAAIAVIVFSISPTGHNFFSRTAGSMVDLGTVEATELLGSPALTPTKSRTAGSPTSSAASRLLVQG